MQGIKKKKQQCDEQGGTSRARSKAERHAKEKTGSNTLSEFAGTGSRSFMLMKWTAGAEIRSFFKFWQAG